jgi:cobyrinic acid a,c-diamide synthase
MPRKQKVIYSQTNGFMYVNEPIKKRKKKTAQLCNLTECMKNMRIKKNGKIDGRYTKNSLFYKKN